VTVVVLLSQSVSVTANITECISHSRHDVDSEFVLLLHEDIPVPLMKYLVQIILISGAFVD